MKTRCKDIFIALLLLGLGSGCESLNDTYDKHAGDGLIRYPAKRVNLVVTPGWEEVKLEWKNTVDPGVVNIRVEWIGGGVTRDTLLEKSLEFCTIPHLGDYTYSFEVFGVDKEGRLSLGALNYARPYSYTHEALSSFTPVVVKYFKVGEDNLVLYFDDNFTNLESALLTYYNKGNGEKEALGLTTSVLSEKYYTLKGVDFKMPITLSREGRIEGLDKTIAFLPLTLDFDIRAINNDFASMVRNYLSVEELTGEVIEGVTELELDLDISSLEDILYFPNLKKLSLGKNRFMHHDYTNEFLSKLFDEPGSKYVLEKAVELTGLIIERYNKHYFLDDLPYLVEMGNPSLPSDLAYLDTDGWKVTHIPEDISGYDSKPGNLIDGNFNTLWSPLSATLLRTHEIIFDMKELQEFRGFKIVQRVPENVEQRAYMPNLIKIQISLNQTEWEETTLEAEYVLGLGSGETTLVLMKEKKEAKYVKIIVYDMEFFSRYNVGLAEFRVIR